MKFLAVLLLVAFVSYTAAQTCGDGVCSIAFAENAVTCPADCDDVCPCRPYCTGRECGPDGCGGSCGTCSAGRTCTGAGKCICNRNCIGKECGDDGCNTGDLCDFCGPSQICGADFRCTGACTPNCRNPDGTLRVCGNDGCFGSCGECAAVSGQDIRCRDGQCVCRPQCDNLQCGSDGCGGNCGTCTGDATCVNGTCVFPVLGCCGDGVCQASLNETTCNCHTDCRGCCLNGVCEREFGETESNCIQDCVKALFIEVRERESNVLVQETCTIAVTGPNSYSATLTYSSPSISWEFQNGGFGTYTFVTTCPSYIGSTQTITVSNTTTLITLLVGLKPLKIEVRDGATNALLSTASINITALFGSGRSQVYAWSSPSIDWTPFIGYGSYQFETSSTGYLTNRETRQVALSTTLITLFLYKNNLPFIVTDCATSAAISGSVVASSSTYATFSATFTTSGTTTIFTHVGFGTYTFAVSSSGYENKTSTVSISQTTTSVTVCLDRSAFCGDGVCNVNIGETANPTSATRCYDCGRLRGVISLAVGQKDQLVNITVSVWADPVNPALYLRNGTAVPAAHFTTLSDSKGFFSVNTLSFDAPSTSTSSGAYKRRFYFSLTGQFTDRTSGVDVTTTLLPLWWNYELTNKQWSGTGDLTGTNNSPSFYFYMTPPFTTNDALIRVILSWGTLISNPSNSLPDMDLVIAGPVDENSITIYGTGILNFQNKDLHSAQRALPYAKLVTDSAQGYGPEVVDFYGITGTLQLGFSQSYAAGAAANAYEIWVDRPNSSPNQDSAFTFLYDTNVFIVVYQNDGTTGGNKQVLFDAITRVPYAYGFYNNDQWNNIPDTATLWHIMDFSQATGGVVYNGFPGENSTTDVATAGSKYGYDGQFFEKTKSIPCGHVASRGASPAYCPATLSYPQSKK